MPRHTRILLGLVLGAVAGVLANLFIERSVVDFIVKYVASPLGQVFLRLIFMLVVPLVVSALIVGVAELGEVRSLGRVGVKTLFYTIVASSISVALGIGLVHLVQPGTGLDPAVQGRLLAEFQGPAQQAVTFAKGSRG